MMINNSAMNLLGDSLGVNRLNAVDAWDAEVSTDFLPDLVWVAQVPRFTLMGKGSNNGSLHICVAKRKDDCKGLFLIPRISDSDGAIHFVASPVFVIECELDLVEAALRKVNLVFRPSRNWSSDVSIDLDLLILTGRTRTTLEIRSGSIEDSEMTYLYMCVLSTIKKMARLDNSGLVIPFLQTSDLDYPPILEDKAL